jgi:hypothetical protein
MAEAGTALTEQQMSGCAASASIQGAICERRIGSCKVDCEALMSRRIDFIRFEHEL